jgi:hypothetical protein
MYGRELFKKILVTKEDEVSNYITRNCGFYREPQ